MNVQLKDITVTARDGRVSHLDQVYIRGSHVRFFIVPDMLRWVEMGWRNQSRVLRLSRGLLWVVAGNSANKGSLVGMRPCSGPGRRRVGEWDWREDARRSIGREGREGVVGNGEDR